MSSKKQKFTVNLKARLGTQMGRKKTNLKRCLLQAEHPRIKKRLFHFFPSLLKAENSQTRRRRLRCFFVFFFFFCGEGGFSLSFFLLSLTTFKGTPARFVPFFSPFHYMSGCYLAHATNCLLQPSTMDKAQEAILCSAQQSIAIRYILG